MKAEIFGKPETEGEKWVLRALDDQAINHERIIYCQSSLVFNKENGQSRTATPDFVMIIPSRGYFVLEVKDWNNIKEATKRKALADGKWWGSPVGQARNGAEILNMNLHRNRDIADTRPPFFYAGILPFIDEDVIWWLINDNYWGAGLLFGRKDVYREAALFQNLMKSRLRRRWKGPMSETVIDAIRALCDPNLVRRNPHTGERRGILDREQERLAKEPINTPPREADDEPAPEQLAMMPDLEKHMKRLGDALPEEGAQLATTRHVRLVRGHIGTGKTDILMMRANYHAGLDPDLRILVVTHNRNLVEKRLRPGLKHLEPSVTVMHFYALCKHVYQNAHDANPHVPTSGLVHKIKNEFPELLEEFSASFLEDEIKWIKEIGCVRREDYLSIPRTGRAGVKGRVLGQRQRTRIFEFFESYQEKLASMGIRDYEDFYQSIAVIAEKHGPRQYDLVIVDEAQHFAPVWMRIILGIRKTTGELFMGDDPSQGVYRNHSWKQKGIPVVGRTRWLKVPYRSTAEIVRVANSLIQGNESVQSLLAETGESVDADLSHPAVRRGARPTKQVFTGPNRLLEEVGAIRRRIQGLIKEFDIMPSEIAVYHEKNWVRARIRKVVPESVTVLASHLDTGLDYTAVFLPALDKVEERGQGGSLETDRAKMLIRLHTAMGRARDHLWLSAAKRWPEFMDPVNEHVDEQYSQ